MSKIHFFDFDGTITKGDTFLAFIRYVKGWDGLLWGFLLHLPVLLLMKLGLYNNGRAKEKLFSYYFKGMSKEGFNALCRDFALKHRYMFRTKALKCIDKALLEGDRVYVVSASIVNWVAPFFVDRDGIKVLGTEIEIVNGRLTGRFSTSNCYGVEKVRRIRPFIVDRRNEYYILAYGDSKGDKELLAFADEAHYRIF